MCKQIMTAETLKDWLNAAMLPPVIDIFQTKVPNVFYVSFGESLYPDDADRLKALNLDVTHSPINRRYMIKFVPSPDDED